MKALPCILEAGKEYLTRSREEVYLGYTEEFLRCFGLIQNDQKGLHCWSSITGRCLTGDRNLDIIAERTASGSYISLHYTKECLSNLDLIKEIENVANIDTTVNYFTTHNLISLLSTTNKFFISKPIVSPLSQYDSLEFVWYHDSVQKVVRLISDGKNLLFRANLSGVEENSNKLATLDNFSGLQEIINSYIRFW